MKHSAKEVLENMFAAFSSGDANRFVATVSDDSVWIYHGTQIIPKGRFEKKEESVKNKTIRKRIKTRVGSILYS